MIYFVNSCITFNFINNYTLDVAFLIRNLIYFPSICFLPRIELAWILRSSTKLLPEFPVVWMDVVGLAVLVSVGWGLVLSAPHVDASNTDKFPSIYTVLYHDVVAFAHDFSSLPCNYKFYLTFFFSLSSNFKIARIHIIHTHTHTHIYIYIYIHINMDMYTHNE